MILCIFVGRLCIQLVRFPEPALHFVVNIRRRCDGNAVRDAVLLSEAAGVDEAACGLGVLESETEIDARVRGGLDLREDVVAIQRDDGLAGAGLHVLSLFQAEAE